MSVSVSVERSTCCRYSLPTLLSSLFVLTLLPCAAATAEDVEVLALVPANYGANTFLNLDDYELFGWNVTLAGVSGVVNACPAYGGPLGCPPIVPDVLVSEVDDVGAYDVLAIMPASQWAGEPYGQLVNSPETLDLIRRAVEAELVVYATCTGVRVLAAAGVIDGVDVSGHNRYANEYRAAGANYLGSGILPVIDQNIVTTTRGLYFHEANSEAIAVALEYRRAQSKSLEIPSATLSSVTTDDDDLVMWATSFGGPSSDGARAVVLADDGNLVVAGYTYSSGSGFSDLLVATFDSEGHQLWATTSGGDGFDAGYGVTTTHDGNIVAVGYTESSGSGGRDVYLVKFDDAGNELWARSFGGPATDVGRAVVATTDGGFAVCGTTESYGAGEDDLFLIKVDSDGSELWSRTFGGTASDVGRALMELPGGDLLLGGATGSFGGGNRDAWLVRTDSAGNEMWSKAYGTNSNYDWGTCIASSGDGSLFVVGSADRHGTRLQDALLVKAGADGSEQWIRKSGLTPFYDYGFGCLATVDGDLLSVGATKDPTTLSDDVYLVGISPDGLTSWTETIAGNGNQWAQSVVETAEGWVIAGHSNTGTQGGLDGWLVKVSKLRPAFTADRTSGMAPLEVQFNDETAGPAVSWAWDLDGDGQVDSEERNPSWTYTRPGARTVRLEVSSGTHTRSLEIADHIQVTADPNGPRWASGRAQP